MATRKLFDATARYLTTTHENKDDFDDAVEKMNALNSKSMMMKHHKQQTETR